MLRPSLAERIPPANVEAEQALLGSLLLDPACAHDVLPVLREADFWRDDHATVFRLIREAIDAGRPLDVAALAEELVRLGRFDEMRGHDLLVDLAESVPHSLDAGYYAKLVRDLAISRDLIAAAGDILDWGYTRQHVGRELADAAERAVFAVGDRRVERSARPLGELVEEAMRRLGQRMMGFRPGLMTGLHEFDARFGGLQPGHLVVLAARPSIGKAQPLDSKVLTPRGFVAMGSLAVGNEVIGSDGRPCKVTGVFPQGSLPVYRVGTTDGGEAECCDEHLWFTQTRNERRAGLPGSVKPLAEIRRTLVRNGSSPNHAIPTVDGVEFAPTDRPELHPYALGLLLGDGSFTGGNIRFSNPEEDLIAGLADHLPIGDTLVVGQDGVNHRIKRARRNNGHSLTSLSLRRLGLFGLNSKEKFIPREYLLGSRESRVGLLRGLFDADGFVVVGGTCIEFSTSSPRLAEDVAFLIRSLGGVVSTRARIPAYVLSGNRKEGALAFRLFATFSDGLKPVLSRKHSAKWSGGPSRYRRSIKSVEFAGYKECQCIAVDAPDHLYVTDDFIVTHNTALALNIADFVASEQAALMISLEMTGEELADRALCGRAEIDGAAFAAGADLSPADRRALERAAARLADSRLFIDDAPAQDVPRISALARRYKAREGIGLLVVDYLQLVEAGDSPRGTPRHELVGSMSRSLKNLGKALQVPVLLLCQLNREVEKREDKRPQMADLRESGSIEQDANMVLLLHRPEFYDPQKSPGQAELIVAKNRGGPTGTVRLAFDKRLTKFSTWSEPLPHGHDLAPDAPY